MPRPRTGTKRGNGEGTVFRRKDGRWVAKLTLPDGRRKDYYGRTRQEAVDKLDKGRNALRVGAILSSDRVTLSDFAQEWFQSKRPAVRYKTYEVWEGLFRLHIHPNIGRIPLTRLTPITLQHLYNKLSAGGLSGSSVNAVHRLLKNMLRSAHALDLVPRCVADLVKGPRPGRREMLVLSVDQAKALLREVDGHRLGTLFELALMSGARVNELLALRWEDVSFDRGEMQIRRALQKTAEGMDAGAPKTASSQRTVPLDKEMLDSLRRHRLRMTEESLQSGSSWAQDAHLVFVTTAGTQLSSTNLIRRQFKPLVRRTGLPEQLRLHDLRHFFASYNLSRGVPVTTVSKVMGHSSPSITHDIYAHCIPGDEERIAANMNKLRAS